MPSKVSSRFSSKLWEDARIQLEEYEKLYQSAQKLTTPLTDEGKKILEQFNLDNPIAWPRAGGAFSKWYRACYDGPVAGYSMYGPSGVLRGTGDLSDYLHNDLRKEHDVIKEIVGQIAPEQFSYRGFKIYNMQRMTDSKCRPMLGAIDYLIELFKRRGVDLGLLKKGLSAVYLWPEIKNIATTGGMSSASGTYLWGVIEMAADAIGVTGAQIKEFINEVFLHEFGHHVHMSVLPKEAKQAWDAPYEEYENTQQEVKLKFKSLSRQERERYFALLEKTGFDVSKAGAKLKGLEKLKFAVWLRDPAYWRKALIKPKRFQLTEEGEQTFGFFKKFYQDPDDYTRRDYRGIDLTPEQLEEKKAGLLEFHMRQLGLDQYQKGAIDISAEQVQELANADPSMQEALDEAERKLTHLKTTLISDYAKTDFREDFAESFVAFMAAPQTLSPESRFRMQRTLSLSGLYGKPVMRLAHRVLGRYLKGVL